MMKARVSRFLSYCGLKFLSIDTVPVDDFIGSRINAIKYRDRDRRIDMVYLVLHVHYDAADPHNRSPHVRQAIKELQQQTQRDIAAIDSLLNQCKTM